MSEVSPGGEDQVTKCSNKCKVDFNEDIQNQESCKLYCNRFKKKFLTGIVSGRNGIKGKSFYRATIGGLRNPRNVVSDLKFTVTTYGPSAYDVG